MAALNIEDIDKMLEESLVDFDFGDEWDDANADPDFQKTATTIQTPRKTATPLNLPRMIIILKMK